MHKDYYFSKRHMREIISRYPSLSREEESIQTLRLKSKSPHERESKALKKLRYKLAKLV